MKWLNLRTALAIGISWALLVLNAFSQTTSPESGSLSSESLLYDPFDPFDLGDTDPLASEKEDSTKIK
jgi:hypothetical protein